MLYLRYFPLNLGLFREERILVQKQKIIKKKHFFTELRFLFAFTKLLIPKILIQFSFIVPKIREIYFLSKSLRVESSYLDIKFASNCPT